MSMLIAAQSVERSLASLSSLMGQVWHDVVVAFFTCAQDDITGGAWNERRSTRVRGHSTAAIYFNQCLYCMCLKYSMICFNYNRAGSSLPMCKDWWSLPMSHSATPPGLTMCGIYIRLDV